MHVIKNQSLNHDKFIFLPDCKALNLKKEKKEQKGVYLFECCWQQKQV